MCSTTASTALSMPRFSAIGLAPAATIFRPLWIIACARMVAVVVPSPATSSVLVATSRTSCAPAFSKGASSSISFAPLHAASRLFLIQENLRHYRHLRRSQPFVARGPGLNLGRGLLHHGEDVTLPQDQVLLVLDLNLAAGVLGEEHPVAGLDGEGDAPLPVLVPLPGTDGDNLTVLGLLLRGVGQHDPALGPLFFLQRLDDDTVAPWAKLPSLLPPFFSPPPLAPREWGRPAALGA